MAGNVPAELAAGTEVGFDATSTGTFTLVEGIESFGAVGDETEAKEKTTINDTRVTYGVGLPDSPDMEIQAIYLKDDTGQTAFRDACKARTEMDIEVKWANGLTGTFKFQPLGFRVLETQANEWIKFAVTGKQNTDVTWVEA